MAAGAFLAAVFGVLVIWLNTNQYATGLALSLFGAGFSAFAGIKYVQEKLPEQAQYPIPFLADVPLLGPALFRQHPMMARPLAPLTLPPSRPTSSKPAASQGRPGIWPGVGAANSAIAASAAAVAPRPSSSTGRSPQRSARRPQGSSLTAMPRPIRPSTRPSEVLSSW